MHINGKTSVMITGCSSGIGLATARGLHQRGYRVFATARKQEDVERLKQQDLQALQLDLTDHESIALAVNSVLSMTGGSLDVLINNGAYGQPGAIEDLETDVLRRQFETNLFGTHELTRRIIPVMRQRNSGTIIQISSILGLVCLPYRGAYNASKYALEALTDTMRLELADTGIRISLIEPGPVKSKFRENAYRAFREAIDHDASVHRSAYRHEIRRLQSATPVPFTLPPESVLEKVLHVLESSQPKIRYPVTKPAQALKFLKLSLSARTMDRLLLKLSGRKTKRNSGG